ncbi:metal-sensing transcriptional repressor [Planococcus donghaensis]
MFDEDCNYVNILIQINAIQAVLKNVGFSIIERPIERWVDK